MFPLMVNPPLKPGLENLPALNLSLSSSRYPKFSDGVFIEFYSTDILYPLIIQTDKQKFMAGSRHWKQDLDLNRTHHPYQEYHHCLYQDIHLNKSFLHPQGTHLCCQ